MAYDVCILGAGLSGLACGRQLLKNCEDIRIVIVEARNRVGGRTLSLPHRGDALDLGGQWIGPSQHRVLALIDDVQLKRVRQEWFDGQAPSPRASGSRPASLGMLNSGSSLPLTEAEAIELANVSARLEGWAVTVKNSASWSRADAVAWDQMSVSEFFDAHVTFPAVRRELNLLVQTVTASEPADLSFLYFLAFLGMCGGLAAVGDGDGGAQSFKVAGGAQHLAYRLAAHLQQRGVEIRLNAVVARIDWQPSGNRPVVVTTSWPSPSSRFRASPESSASTAGAAPVVSTPAEEVEILASKLVVAVSPPLWTSSMEWNPPLPPCKANIARRMYMGSAVKTISIFRTRFWREVSATQSTESPAGPGHAAVRLEDMNRAPSSQGRLEELGPVANLFPSTVAGAPALIGLVTGAAAIAFMALSEHERRTAVLQQYQQFFGDDAAQAECTDFFSKGWMSEPFSRGCFAALMPKGLASCGGGTARSPLGSGSIFFAGTELATEWAGYFEGAIEAGYRAADEVSAALRESRWRLGTWQRLPGSQSRL